MKDFYLHIAMAHFAVLAVIWIGFIGWVLSIHARAFVNDSKPDWPEWTEDKIGDLVIFGLPIGVFAGLGWAVLWLLAAYFGPLYLARTFIRARKVFEAHKHDSDGNVIKDTSSV